MRSTRYYFKSVVSIVFLGLIMSFGLFQDEGKTIAWSENRPLKWEDFQGPPADDSPYKALTDYRITFKGSINPNNYGKKGPNVQETVYEVDCMFNIDRSWVKEGARTEELLKHEQVHFDIAEWHARTLRKELDKLKTADPKTQKLATKLFQDISRDCRRLQEQYDSNTDHGVKPDQQEEWSGRVAKELKKLSKYAKE
ncbi:MAG: DUF922 domain-containing protein [Flavobacteriales bacterium]|nr:DUF922 domain-containing protein [Flavobacteriales bacterium]